MQPCFETLPANRRPCQPKGGGGSHQQNSASKQDFAKPVRRRRRGVSGQKLRNRFLAQKKKRCSVYGRKKDPADGCFAEFQTAFVRRYACNKKMPLSLGSFFLISWLGFICQEVRNHRLPSSQPSIEEHQSSIHFI